VTDLLDDSTVPAPRDAPALVGIDAPGWYGKLPSLGDFAQRRLPPDFVQAWDDWLARELSAWQQADPAGWLERYLAGTSWRFMLLPRCVAGFDETAAVAGVLMPSVDRVGRYFPLTIAWRLPAAPADTAALQQAFSQMHRLDDLALDALQEDWTPDRLEAELAAFARRGANAGPAGPGPHAGLQWTGELPAAGMSVDIPWHNGIASTLADLAWARLLDLWHGAALWWSEPEPGRTRLRLSAGLPRGDAFVALFEAPGSADAAASRDHPTGGMT
jgi:type VI secretion system protein ImpM